MIEISTCSHNPSSFLLCNESERGNVGGKVTNRMKGPWASWTWALVLVLLLQLAHTPSCTSISELSSADISCDEEGNMCQIGGALVSTMKSKAKSKSKLKPHFQRVAQALLMRPFRTIRGALLASAADTLKLGGNIVKSVGINDI